MRPVIFGAKGDLARRKLLPSLYQLEKAGQIHADTRIIGVGRADWDKAAYTKVVREALETFMKEKIDEGLWDTLSGRTGSVILTSMTPAASPAWVRCWIKRTVSPSTISLCRRAPLARSVKGWAKRSLMPSLRAWSWKNRSAPRWKPPVKSTTRSASF